MPSGQSNAASCANRYLPNAYRPYLKYDQSVYQLMNLRRDLYDVNYVRRLRLSTFRRCLRLHRCTG